MSASIGISFGTFVAWSPGCVYFRILGRGLALKDYRRHPPLFSERNGLVKTLRVGKNWRVIPLPRM